MVLWTYPLRPLKLAAMLLPLKAAPMLALFAAVFTAPIVARFRNLLIAALLTPGRRTVSGVLHTLGHLFDVWRKAGCACEPPQKPVKPIARQRSIDSDTVVIWWGSGSKLEVRTAIMGSKRNARSMRLASQASWNPAPSPS